MGGLTHFCPNCWAEIAEGAASCSHCGCRPADLDAAPFETKLIRSLGHPIREARMMAIQILGERGSRAAIPALASLIREEPDPYVLGEVARALARIDDDAARALLTRLRAHRSAIVRLAAGATRRGSVAGDE